MTIVPRHCCSEPASITAVSTPESYIRAGEKLMAKLTASEATLGKVEIVPPPEPQVGEWWWVEFGGDPEIARVLAVGKSSYVVRFADYLSFARERTFDQFIARVATQDQPKPGLFARLWAWMFGG